MARSVTTHRLFLDESGDHGLDPIDPNWPIFVLVGVLVGEVYYQKTLVPRVRRLKSEFGIGRDVPLHSRDIRRRQNGFEFLHDRSLREQFMDRIGALFTGSRLRIYAVVVDKYRLRDRYGDWLNPYDVSLSQLLSVVCGPPSGLGRPNVTAITAESRGKVEDRQLQAEYQAFRRHGLFGYGALEVSDRFPATVRQVFPNRVAFPRKSKCIAGLELADLAAYPIGTRVLHPSRTNPAYEAVSARLKAMVRQ